MGSNNTQVAGARVPGAFLTALAAALALAALVVLAVAAVAVPATAHALEGQAYTYTVRVLAGNQGTVNGDSIVTISGVEGGSKVYLAKQVKAAVKDDSKYYVRGFRVSGRDNDDGLYANSASTYVTVNEDMDFVVSYGMKGNMVPYKVHFVEYQTGKVLADPVTHYGAEGDKPVVSYEYIQGYRPRYRNITGTLGPKGTNDWTFEYIKLAEGENENGTTTTTTTTTTTAGNAGRTTGGTAATGTTGGGTAAGGNAASGAAASAGAASAGAASAGAASAGAASAGAADASAGAASAAATPATPPATEEIVDIDNPMASGADDADKSGASADAASQEPAESNAPVSDDTAGIPLPAIYGIAALVVAAIAAVLVFLKRRRDAEYDQIFAERNK